MNELEFGKEIIGKKVVIPWGLLKSWESVKGQVYELHIKLGNRPTESQVDKILKIVPSELQRKFGAKVRYLKIGDGYMIMQIEGSPFEWSALIPYLSSILTWIGLIVVGIAVLLIIKKSTWEVFLLVIGLILALGAPDIAKAIKEAMGVKEEKKRIIKRVEVE